MVAERKYDRAKLVPLICARLSTGKEPLTVICKDLGVNYRVVNHWREKDVDIALQFDEARDMGYDAIAADCLAIADNPEMGVETTVTATGGIETRKGDMLQHRKLRIETRLKLLAKWDPRRYGDRLALANDPKHPLTDAKPTQLTEDQLLQIAMNGTSTDG
jgi:hypothetical protein